MNRGCKELEYKAYQDKGKNSQKLFKDILEFNQVRVFEDLSKKEIIEQLEDLKNTARQYEFENEKGTLSISITWIGFKLQASWFTPHKLLLTKLQKEVAQTNLKKVRKIESQNSILDLTLPKKPSLKGN